MTCKHQMFFVNQDVHWCELQKDCYPHCEQCLSYQPQPTVTKYMLIRKDEQEPLGYFNTKGEVYLELARRVKTDLENDKFISNIYKILRVELTSRQ